MNDKKRHSLDGEWELSFTAPGGETVRTTAPVPGNVEPVLVRLGLLKEYMPADSQYATADFEAVDDWRYTTVFDAPPLKPGWERCLVFEGIDAIAEIFLNGEPVCSCNDMHLSYRIAVSHRLREKGNRLEVVIRSSQLWARRHCHDSAVKTNGIPSLYDSRTYLRKARHQWGWDNAPRLLTSGIIRKVYLEDLPPARFEEVYLYTLSVTPEEVRIGADWIYRADTPNLKGHTLEMLLLDKEQVVYREIREVYFVQGWLRFGIPRDSVRLWWPEGFGEPHLYTVRLTMYQEGAVKAVYQAPFGIRTLRLERTSDIREDGSGEFVFRVNGEKVYIRGTNWKPLDPLASAADAKTRAGEALARISDLHCNMVRIWGGGIYEDDAFYDYCDRHGIMVWQDFMFACEVPAADGWYAELVAKEAEQVIKRLRNHPSLALWCGDNEDDEATFWTHKDSTLLPSSGLISRKVLKNAVLHFDPYRSYLESSPYASDANFTLRRQGALPQFQPEMHLYLRSAGMEAFAKELRSCRGIFMGEIGPNYLGSAAVNPKIYEREKARAERLWEDPGYNPQNGNIHQMDSYFSCWRYVGKKWCEAVFHQDFPFARWRDAALAVNVIAAEQFKDIIEYCRVARWSKSGVIWWSLMDMWPMLFNLSVIDCDGNPKLPYFWIRQSQQAFALMGVRKEAGGELALYAVNDTLVPHTAAYTVTAYHGEDKGEVIATGICRQEANSASLIQRIAPEDRPALWLIAWEEDGKRSFNHVMTGMPDFAMVRPWVSRIGKHCGFYEQIREIR